MRTSNYLMALGMLVSLQLTAQTSFVSNALPLAPPNNDLESLIRQSPEGLDFEEQIDDEHYYVLPGKDWKIQKIPVQQVYYVFKHGTDWSRIIVTGEKASQEPMRKHLQEAFGPSNRSLVDTGFWKTSWVAEQYTISLYENIHGDFSIHIEPR